MHSPSPKGTEVAGERPHPKMSVAPNESNLLEMHYVIEGSKGTPYEGGVYHGKLIFPKEYPLKPPSVIMLTPSGRFQPNRRLCLSVSALRTTCVCMFALHQLLIVSLFPSFCLFQICR